MSFRLATAPCLLRELFSYTPQAPAFSSALDARCEHVYATSSGRSVLPQLDQQPVNSTRWAVEATCVRCRCHLHLAIDFSSSQQPCPTHDFPLHHFQIAREPTTDGRVQTYGFSCGADDCKASLVAELRAPVLTAAEIILLVDNAALDRRAQETSEHREQRIPASSAFEALSVLRSYVRDAVSSDQEKKIPATNKRFMLALGEQARPLLSKLGFEYDQPKDGTAWPVWRLPNVKSAERASQRVMLQDAEDELVTLLQSRPSAEKATAKEPVPDVSLAMRDMERVLGSLDYATAPMSSRQQPLSRHVRDSFSQLGALPDFSDDLVLFAYDRNVNWNPPSSPVYFQLLRNIAAFRNSESLSTKVATLQSAGQVAQDDVVAAYQYFDIHPDREATFSDEQILGKYQSIYPDIGADEQARAKQALITISHARGSKFLQNAATDRFETYEEALAYLGAEKSTPDDFILSLVTAKSGDDVSSQQIALRALAVIADARNSETLRYQGQRDVESTTMALPQAYTLLGVSEPDGVDEEMISVLHGVAVGDNPSRVPELNEALSVIAEARNSSALRTYLNDSQSQINQSLSQGHVPPMHPRGLFNIGNTCYLNSLLQYLYSIKPLREMLKNFEAVKQSLDGPFAKKIAGINATEAQVHKSHEFVQELRKLFANLESTNDQAVAPEVNLARLTIGEPTASHSDPKSPAPTTSRRLTISSGKSVTSVPVFKEAEASQPSVVAAQGPQGESPMDTSKDEPSQLLSPDQVMSNAEEDPSQPTTAAHESDQGEDDSHPSGGSAPVEDMAVDAAPSTQDVKRQTEEWAMQQDVTEALENVVKQLQWAVKPESIDSSGDQVDLISRLFWGTMHVMYSRSGVETKETLPFKDVIVRPDYNPTDLNEALDDTEFGQEDHGPDFYKYNVIASLPPIVHMAVSRAKEDESGKSYTRNTNQLVLHSEIFLDRYLEDEEMVSLRKKAFMIKHRLRTLRASCDALSSTTLKVSASEVLESAYEHATNLESQAAGEQDEIGQEALGVRQSLEAEARAADLRIQAVKGTMQPLEEKLAALYTPGGKKKYSLQAVFVHKGTGIISGHWLIYIFDQAANIWREYNDDRVTVVDPSQLEAKIYAPDESARGVSAYLSYVQSDLRDEIFEPVAREPQVKEENEEDLIQLDGVEQSEADPAASPTAKPPAPPPRPQPGWDDRGASADHAASW